MFMNNFMISLKRFFKNKNTVTIIGVILIVLILFFGYRTQINKQVEPISVPVAAETIQPRTKITSDMITTMDVANYVLDRENVITDYSQIKDKYSNYNTVIPKGSMFYKGVVVDEEELPNSAFVNLGEDEIPYNFPVNMDTTYGNSIMPDSYIDIYMKAENESGQLMVGKLINNVKVLAVKDSSGQHVFENSDEARTPAFLIFGLEPELNILLRKASYMNSYSVELFPVPHGVEVTANENETVVSSNTLKDFINANTVPNDEIAAEKAAKEAAEKAAEEAKNNKTSNATTNNNSTTNNTES